MEKQEVVKLMYRMAQNISELGDFGKQSENMLCIDELYSLAQDGIITMESFDSVFFSYLYDGKPLDWGMVWLNKKPSLIDRIKRIFKK